MLYDCKTRTKYHRYVLKLDSFHLRCIRKIMRIDWEDLVINQEEVSGTARHWSFNPPTSTEMIGPSDKDGRLLSSKAALQSWTSHRHEKARKINQAVRGWTKASAAYLQHSRYGRESLAANISAWHQTTYQGIRSLKKSLEHLDPNRQARKERRPSIKPAAACPISGRVCASELGRQPHPRRH